MAVKHESSRPGSLERYHKKRDFAQTPEPSGRTRRGGAAAGRRKMRFVVQMHRATRLHYDFRLEAGGVLASWAVPKGPTLVSGDRRLAMHVEDHPLDYRDFEGNIPAGQYGAGSVIVWDRGTYTLAEGDDPAAEIGAGKITFILHGKKLRGEFTLVKIKAREGESGEPWLLIKDRDEYSDARYDPAKHPESVKSGKTLADVAGDKRARTWQSKPSARQATATRRRSSAGRDPLPHPKALMLATLIDEPFDDPEWLFEIKWDGYRALCTIDAGKLSLVSRNGLDMLARFPDLAQLSTAFASVPVMVDGEIVSLDSRGRSSFQRLQESQKKPAGLTYAAFDLLYADGADLRSKPLEERKALLERLIRDDGVVLYSKHVVERGVKLFENARKRGLEGIIGKKRSSTYQERRSRDWVKIKTGHEQEFVVGGWTDPKGSRKGFGALLLGVYHGGALRYVGSVGTGFSAKLLTELAARLRKLERKTSPFGNDVEVRPRPHWTSPELVVEVRFSEWTRDGYLRQPAYLGLRPDKRARDVVAEIPVHAQ
ncbi:MAG: non-homologous end-joining DNA ligase [Candidatus Eremiobacteraeota bacterium]|nr:non-homologous end-joining DNA ligase [Candidatus Eremiobacteraeota bacterium]MBV8499834.1 non-homologous end-joining DNA ligase [Candidatus Eremiobacteraeota bacterium]